jgi:benzodiazapine receptor
VTARARAVAIAAAAAVLVAVVGGLATDLGPWYANLRQPAWKPPDSWFGPVWTAIYALTAAAAVRAWTRAKGRAARDTVLVVAALNAFLNVLWSLLFFRLRRPDWALIEVVPLWLSIVAMMVVFGRSSRGAALLLLPYLGWVAFAATLNNAVVRLNGPFGGA